MGHKRLLESHDDVMLLQKIQLRAPYVTPLNVLQVPSRSPLLAVHLLWPPLPCRVTPVTAASAALLRPSRWLALLPAPDSPHPVIPLYTFCRLHPATWAADQKVVRAGRCSA